MSETGNQPKHVRLGPGTFATAEQTETAAREILIDTFFALGLTNPRVKTCLEELKVIAHALPDDLEPDFERWGAEKEAGFAPGADAIPFASVFAWAEGWDILDAWVIEALMAEARGHEPDWREPLIVWPEIVEPTRMIIEIEPFDPVLETRLQFLERALQALEGHAERVLEGFEDTGLTKTKTVLNPLHAVWLLEYQIGRVGFAEIARTYGLMGKRLNRNGDNTVRDGVNAFAKLVGFKLRTAPRGRPKAQG